MAFQVELDDDKMLRSVMLGLGFRHRVGKNGQSWLDYWLLRI